MIKKICTCDRCGEQTDVPVLVTFNKYDLKKEAIVEPAFQPETRHYCPDCADYVYWDGIRYCDTGENQTAMEALNEIVDTSKTIVRAFDSLGVDVIGIDEKGDVHVFDARIISKMTGLALSVERIKSSSEIKYMMYISYLGTKFYSYNTREEVESMGICTSE